MLTTITEPTAAAQVRAHAFSSHAEEPERCRRCAVPASAHASVAKAEPVSVKVWEAAHAPTPRSKAEPVQGDALQEPARPRRSVKAEPVAVHEVRRCPGLPKRGVPAHDVADGRPARRTCRECDAAYRAHREVHGLVATAAPVQEPEPVQPAKRTRKASR